jgi:hypothetical protein
MYQEGRGVEKNLQTSERLLNQAVTHPSMDKLTSLRNIGKCKSLHLYCHHSSALLELVIIIIIILLFSHPMWGLVFVLSACPAKVWQKRNMLWARPT